VDIKGKTCKIDFNMMLPFDYPRSPPNVRIVNRNPDYVVDAFYKQIQSKTDPSSYILNTKL
jgi:ubiquitin-protein ligase